MTRPAQRSAHPRLWTPLRLTVTAIGVSLAVSVAAQTAVDTTTVPTATVPTATVPSATGPATSMPSWPVVPGVQVSLGPSTSGGTVPGTPGGAAPWNATLNILALMTVLTIGPALLVSVTSFSRILISLHFLRQALGTQTAPGNQVLVGLALFLTWFTMAPVFDHVWTESLTPLTEGRMDAPQALATAWPALRDFMLPQTRTADLNLFMEIAKLPEVPTATDIPARVLVPAFVISEINTAFQIGVLLYIPFLLLDLLVSSVLLSLGMLQLPPIVVSTPLKLILFVIVDGWHLVIGSLVRSFT